MFPLRESFLNRKTCEDKINPPGFKWKKNMLFLQAVFLRRNKRKRHKKSSRGFGSQEINLRLETIKKNKNRSKQKSTRGLKELQKHDWKKLDHAK